MELNPRDKMPGLRRWVYSWQEVMVCSSADALFCRRLPVPTKLGVYMPAAFCGFDEGKMDRCLPVLPFPDLFPVDRTLVAGDVYPEEAMARWQGNAKAIRGRRLAKSLIQDAEGHGCQERAEEDGQQPTRQGNASAAAVRGGHKGSVHAKKGQRGRISQESAGFGLILPLCLGSMSMMR